MRNKKEKRFIKIILLAVIAVCLVQIGQAYYLSLKHQSQQRELQELAKETASESPEQEEAAEEEKTPAAEELTGEELAKEGQAEEENQPEAAEEKEEQEPVILEKYQELYAKNPDMTGWLSIEGMKIDYPVMRCQDGEYYLHHNFYGEEDKYGCLFIKEEADVDTPGSNFVIYGHNMKDGSMFGDLDLYRKEDFFREHAEISFDTLYEERTYEIMAVFLSQVYESDEDVFKYYQFYEAETQEEFDTFYENVKKLSFYDTGVEAEYGDTFLTLSTCAYHVEDGRLVIVAKKRN